MDRKQTRDFEGFVTESGDTLLRMATLLTADPDQAEDVYQETLRRLAVRWSRVENPRAFCRRVMNNIVIENPKTGAVLETAFIYPDGTKGIDLYQPVTTSRSVSPNPYVH